MEVVTIDLPGHGRSPGNGCETIEQYGDAVCDALEDRTPCYVAGHSLGGAVAMHLALVHPDLVKGIILIGSGARLKVLPRILEGIVADKERTVADINVLSCSQATSKAAREEVLGMVMGCAPEVIYKDFAACDGFDIMASVGSIRVPALVICGEDDALTPVKYSQFLARNIPGSELVIIRDAGHMVMVEKPAEVSKVIKAFVETHN
jgi:pimeloyl-ACP methyl ester carboxylesterase